MLELENGVLLSSPAKFAHEASGGRWLPAPHLVLLSDAIYRTVNAPHGRLIVTMPPRHGKSELISKHTPAWFLSRFPDRRVGLASYEASFAAYWGDAAKAIYTAMSPRFHGSTGKFPQGPSDWWRTHRGGYMFTAGVGGPITGKGADLFVIDDPVKNWQEAQSATQRQHIWEWFTSTAYTRLEPGGSVILLMTRWHEDDLAGRLLRAMKDGGEQWDVLHLAALAERDDPLGRAVNEPLWGERFNEPDLRRIQVTLGDNQFAALYQGHPRAAEGAVLGPPHYYTERLRDRFTLGAGLDLAYTAKTSSDYSVIVEARKIGEYVYIDNVIRRQVRAPAFAAELKSWRGCNPNTPLLWYASGTETGVADLINEFGKGIGILVRPALADKLQRAQRFAAAWNAGTVLLPQSAPWLTTFVEELEKFTGTSADEHDDQVDAAVAAFDILNSSGSQAMGAGERTHSKVKQF